MLLLKFLISVIFAFLVLLLYSFLFFLVGYILIKHFPRLGSFFWGMSGLFKKTLSKKCPADRCDSCNIWSCPLCNKSKGDNI